MGVENAELSREAASLLERTASASGNMKGGVADEPELLDLEESESDY